MASALVLLADGTEEIEFVTSQDVLVRAGFSVRSVGVNLQHHSWAVCSRGVKIIPDIHDISNLSFLYADPDVLIVPGGAPGATTLTASSTVLEMVQRLRGQAKRVACICAGTLVLVRSVEVPSIFDKKECRVTSHPSVKQEIVNKGWDYYDDDVVEDDRVITSRGPGTAIMFALAIVESLLGKARRDEVAGPLMVPGV
ncbi:MAG: hypothetical protein M1838_002052 [Thelocarpon superellum]|nr:MAG: hypothetical protein M1838_002052 [Thelocarpon superellum]